MPSSQPLVTSQSWLFTSVEINVIIGFIMNEWTLVSSPDGYSLNGENKLVTFTQFI